ncbi:hypothetical protein JNW90_28650 [Micromonospora sp. STR1s_5]|nr:hypothetical protein [Micromonospora sp. STR1s_5]
MHFSLIKPRSEMLRGYPTMEDALASPSTLSLCDGPLLDDGVRNYIVGRVIGFMEGR